jgi:hypothetical protein
MTLSNNGLLTLGNDSINYNGSGSIVGSSQGAGNAFLESTFTLRNTGNADGLVALSGFTTTSGSTTSNSPDVRLGSTVWDTGASANRVADFAFENDPTSGNPGTAALNTMYRYNSGSYSNLMTILSSGNVGIGTTSPNAALDVNSTSIIIEKSNTPADNATCTAGTIWWDTSYIYVCTASGTVKRAALSTF